MNPEDLGQKADFEYFTIYDSKSRSYRDPVHTSNKLTFLRDLENLMKAPDARKSEYFLNAEDFSAFKIGSFDRKTGRISLCDPEHVVNFHDVRSMVEQQNVKLQRDVSPQQALFPT